MGDAVTRIARIEMPDGTPVWARISGAEELEAVSGELSYTDTGFGERVEAQVESLRSVIVGVARSLAAPLRAVRPDEVSVEFGIELTAKAGKVVGLLADGEAKAGITVTLTWNGGPPDLDAVPPDTEGAGGSGQPGPATPPRAGGAGQAGPVIAPRAGGAGQAGPVIAPRAGGARQTGPLVAPHATTPHATAPHAGDPWQQNPATAPEATAAQATGAQATAPEATAAQATAPQATAPQATAPRATAPHAGDPWLRNPATGPHAGAPPGAPAHGGDPDASLGGGA